MTQPAKPSQRYQTQNNSDEPKFGAMTALVPDDFKLSKGMKALSPKARGFVLALVELGGRDQKIAAERAGYTGTGASLAVTGHRLAADPRVQAVIVEEAQALARASSLAAVAVTVSIMNDEGAGKQVRLNAAGRIMALAALEPEKTSNVNHIIEVKPTTKEQIDQVVRMATDVGMDPRKLLGKAGIILDADFSVVASNDGLEDLLE